MVRQISATLVKGKARIKFDAPKVREWRGCVWRNIQ